jgi:hypothetical protein
MTQPVNELGFRACRECGQRALIELSDGKGWTCARCYVRRRRLDPVAHGVAAQTLGTMRGAPRIPPTGRSPRRS